MKGRFKGGNVVILDGEVVGIVKEVDLASDPNLFRIRMKIGGEDMLRWHPANRLELMTRHHEELFFPEYGVEGEALIRPFKSQLKDLVS